jgi:hypothetical protein
MSYFIIDINTDFDLDKIIIGKPVMINDELTKIFIYYLDNNIPKEIIIKTPPFRLIYTYKNLKYNQIKLPIYPIWENTNKFIKLIKKIEKYIRVNIKCEKSIYTNSIEKNDSITTLKLNVTPDVKISSQLYTSLADLKVNGEIETIFNISYIWVKKNSYGLSLSCHQIKYTPRIDELNIDFFDENKNTTQLDNYKYTNNTTQLDNYKYTNNTTQLDNYKYKENKIHIIDTPSINIKPMLLISTSLLSDAITKLNKVKN